MQSIQRKVGDEIPRKIGQSDAAGRSSAGAWPSNVRPLGTGVDI
jgi:hypothetical protein